MHWSEFFEYRKRMQRLKMMGGIPFAMGFLAVEGAAAMSLPVIDPTQLFLGLDPVIVLGLSTVIGSTASFLAGSSITKAIHQRIWPTHARIMDEMQRKFYNHIIKHRANVPPSPTQFSGGIDFYGERIDGIASYRHWLRRQRQLKSQRAIKSPSSITNIIS